ncbi:MAG TPA: ABC transporter permease [Terriglobales bacterium]|nr:ABC transporter permease [Terriglobales bacterium]
MTGIIQDIRYAFRQLSKNPGFAATSVLTLALGIGANVAVFSVMNAILLNPSGIPHPERVVALRTHYAAGDLGNISLSAPDFGDAVVAKNIFTSAAVLMAGDFNYSGDGTNPEKLSGAMVSWQWFDVFWARPYLGRVFRPEEDQPNANREVVLSYLTWQRHFGADPSILGRSLLLNQESYQVVGVMGPGFNWPNAAELWVPIGLPPGRYFDPNYRYNENLFSVARLRPEVSFEQANSFLHLRSAQDVAAEGVNSYGKAAGWNLFCMPMVDFVAGDLRKPLFVLLTAVGTILLIACANIAGLQLARASGRQREVSIQIALGAGRSRLLRQAFAESLLLATIGVALGLGIAKAAIPLLLFLAPDSLVLNVVVHNNLQVLLFALLAGVICVLLCGVAPAWQMTHARWFQALQEGGRSETSSRARQRLRSLLVIGEIGLAMLLLVGAGLLLRSMQQLEQVQTGFNPRGLISAQMSLPPTVYKTDEQKVAFFAAAEDQLNNIPGATVAAFTDTLPFTAGGGMSSFSIKGRPQPPNDPGPHGNIRYVSSGYFSALQIPLLRGRNFVSEDRLKTEQVVVIDETLAHQYWSNEDPIGQHIRFGDESPWMTVVGLVKHAKSSSLESDTKEGFYYLPLSQAPQASVALLVRTDNDNPASLKNALQTAIGAVNSNQPIYDIKTMEERVDQSLVSRRFLVILLSVFAGLALLLAALGLYGVISYSVKMRTRELGIRMALGAKRADVLRLVLGKGLQLALAGLAVGFVGTLAIGRTLSSLLYHVSLFNPLTLLLTSVLLASTVLLASYFPARRAAQLDPMKTLREE